MITNNHNIPNFKAGINPTEYIEEVDAITYFDTLNCLIKSNKFKVPM